MATVTTPTSAEAWRPDQISAFNPEDLVSDALIMQAATQVGSVEGDAPAVRCAYVSDDPSSGFVAEGAQIAEADPTLSEVVVTTRKIATLVKVSREQASQAGAAERIANSMQRSIVTKANAAFLTNTSDPKGLLKVSGVKDAGALESDLFALSDAVGAIEADGGAATHIVVNPLDWATLSKIPAAAGSNVSVLGEASAAPERKLSGLPVLVSPAMTAGKMLVLDSSEVAAAYGPVSLARSEDAYFDSDSVGVRATWRLGWTVVRPARLQTLTVGATGA